MVKEAEEFAAEDEAKPLLLDVRLARDQILRGSKVPNLPDSRNATDAAEPMRRPPDAAPSGSLVQQSQAKHHPCPQENTRRNRCTLPLANPQTSPSSQIDTITGGS